ncbi:hypothetical protein LPU83_pLPU83c_0268 (plasmid) [Rhizobium favelukesii]|uniref:Uncharacterized protein n=1 Tax=Rhizobium favelukesii TaxID=348824 RepID=W6RKH8_9HYPH|nr:hypothetical protein LPU83_pLPU83c_0268 [Rhizobium favelukesii]
MSEDGQTSPKMVHLIPHSLDIGPHILECAPVPAEVFWNRYLFVGRRIGLKVSKMLL